MAEKVEITIPRLTKVLTEIVADRAYEYHMAGKEASEFADALGPDAKWYWAGWDDCVRAFGYAVAQVSFEKIKAEDQEGEVRGGSD